eukprot:1001599-Rhodomonas_salina.8
MAGEVDSCEEDDDDGSRQGEAPASSEKNTGGKRKNGKGRKKFKGRKAPPMTKEEKQAQHRQRQADEKFKEEQRQYQDYLREYEKKIKEVASRPSPCAFGARCPASDTGCLPLPGELQIPSGEEKCFAQVRQDDGGRLCERQNFGANRRR